jgi:hypothetical protein
MSSTRLDKQFYLIPATSILAIMLGELVRAGSLRLAYGALVRCRAWERGMLGIAFAIVDCHIPLYHSELFHLCLTLQVLKGLGNVKISVIAFRPKGAVQVVLDLQSVWPVRLIETNHSEIDVLFGCQFSILCLLHRVISWSGYSQGESMIGPLLLQRRMSRFLDRSSPGTHYAFKVLRSHIIK